MILTTFTIVIYIIGHDLSLTDADFEVCNPGVSNHVYQFMYDNCPYGVLFDHPVMVNCLASTNYPEHFLTDLCNPGNSSLNVKDHPYKIHLAFHMENEPVDSDNSCYGIGSDKCDAQFFIQATNGTMTPPIGLGCEMEHQEVVHSIAAPEDNARKDPQVFAQTEKLFKHMMGLINENKRSDTSELRVIKLLKFCFKIFKKFSDGKFIPPEFGNDVLNSFLFLFYDSDLSNFIDISIEDFLLIQKTLTLCKSMVPPFILIGRSCTTCANVYAIAKMGKTLRYVENEFSFVYGKYDVPVDATWNIVSFVYGLCYGTYKLHVNYHHLYEREMERLFTPEILYRWSRPPMLYHEDLWDHIFSTSVKSAMRNLDVSVFGAYFDTPFLHRLERPINAADKMVQLGKKRKTRSLLPTMSLDDGGLQGAGWCFQTEEALIATVAAYINHHCPSASLPQEITMKPTEAPNVRGLQKSNLPESDEFARA